MNTQPSSRKFSSLRTIGCGLLVTLTAVAMSGCGGGGDGGDDASPQTATATEQAVSSPAPTPNLAPNLAPAPVPSPAPAPDPQLAENHKPTISGSGPAAVNANSTYNFVPTAIDADGDTLAFSIQNKPSWANFSTATGQLSGTPGAGDVGTYSNIAISVSDGNSSNTTSPFAIAVTAISDGRVTLSWVPPTENTDGTPLTNLASFKISYGTSPSALTRTIAIANPGVTTYVVENLSPATWYFAVIAVSASGSESDNSNIANKTI